MIVEAMSVEDFEGFVNNHVQHSFWQTEGFAKRRVVDGWKYDYLGFYDDGKCVGAGMFFKRKLPLNKVVYECMGGPILDYSDPKKAFEALAKYLETHQVHECLINPNLISYIHNIEEGTKEELNNFEEIRDVISSTGFKFLENTDPVDNMLNWFYKKEIGQYESEDELLDSFERETKRLIGLALKSDLVLEELEPKDFTRVKRLIDMTATNKEFDSRSLEYYETLHQYFNEKNTVKMMVVTLDVKAYRTPLENTIEDLKAKIEADKEVNTKRSLNRVNQNTDVLNATQKKLDLIKDVKEDKVDICGGVFLFTDNEATYLLGGSDAAFFAFNGPQFLQWNMILEARSRKINTYNFHGTRGSFINRPDEDGVYMFKKGFNGQLQQNFGFFEYYGHGFTNSILRTLKNLKSKIR